MTRPGRKQDPTRDGDILDAALEVLAETGYERMTMDAVAARAKAGKATVYRRWPSKAHMVVDAVARMSAQAIDLDALPDTGTLRGDLAGLIRPEALDHGAQRMKVMAAVASMVAVLDDPDLAAAAATANTQPWIVANRLLIERAVARGEAAATVDVALAADLVPALCYYRVNVQAQPLTAAFILAAVDDVLLPTLGVEREKTPRRRTSA